MNTAQSTSTAQKYPPTFYISSHLLSSHVNRTVRVLGRVQSVSADGRKVQLESCDGGIVSVLRSNPETPFNTKFVCVTGKVQNDLTVNESISECIGDNFGLQDFEKVIRFMEKAPRLFSVL